MICHKEREYACRLANYLNQHSNGEFLTMAVTKPEQVRELHQEGTDLLLIDEEYKIESADCVKNGTACCYLTKERQKRPEEIFLYSTASEIYDRIRKELITKQSVFMETGYLEAIVDFTGCTDSQRWLHRAEDKQLLFWEWKPFSEFYVEKNMESFLYDVKRHKKDVGKQLMQYVIYRENCAVLPAPDYCMDMRTIDSNDLQWLLDIIGEAGFAGICVALDFACLGNLELLKQFYKITLCLPDEEWLKRPQYESVLKYFNYLDIPKSRIEYDILKPEDSV